LVLDSYFTAKGFHLDLVQATGHISQAQPLRLY